jgi:hypothetical protein
MPANVVGCKGGHVALLEIVSNEKWKEYNMKNRAITLAFAACFVSSLAFADNPSDAPLVNDDARAMVIQRDNRVDHSRRHPKKKDESPSIRAKVEDSSKNNRQGEQSHPENLVTANN